MSEDESEKRGRGRPKGENTVMFTTKITKKVLKGVHEYNEETGVSISHMTSKALELYIEIMKELNAKMQKELRVKKQKEIGS